MLTNTFNLGVRQEMFDTLRALRRVCTWSQIKMDSSNWIMIGVLRPCSYKQVCPRQWFRTRSLSFFHSKRSTAPWRNQFDEFTYQDRIEMLSREVSERVARWYWCPGCNPYPPVMTVKPSSKIRWFDLIISSEMVGEGPDAPSLSPLALFSDAFTWSIILSFGNTIFRWLLIKLRKISDFQWLSIQIL